MAERDHGPNHLCWLYGTRGEWQDIAARLLTAGARRRERLIYVGDRAPEVLHDDLDRFAERDHRLLAGDLRIVSRSRDRAHDPLASDSDDLRLSGVRDEVWKARAAGYTGVRIVAEATGRLEYGSQRHIAVELRIDRLTRHLPVSVFCGYDRRQVDALTESTLAFVHACSPRQGAGSAAGGLQAVGDRQWRLQGPLDDPAAEPLREALAALPRDRDLHLDATGTTWIGGACQDVLHAFARALPDTEQVTITGVPDGLRPRLAACPRVTVL